MDLLGILQALQEPETSADDLALTIRRDAGLSVRLLRVANSAYFAPPVEWSRSQKRGAARDAPNRSLGSAVLNVGLDVEARGPDLYRPGTGTYVRNTRQASAAPT